MLKPQLMALDASLNRDVLIKYFKNFQVNEFADMIDKELDPILGHNPFFLNGNDWKEKRSEITPAFTVSRVRQLYSGSIEFISLTPISTSNQIKAMYPLVEGVCKNLVEFIEKESLLTGSSGIDARELSAKYTTDVVSNCIFALDAGSLRNEDAEIRKMGKKMMAPDNWKMFLLFVIGEMFPITKKVIRLPFVDKPIETFFANLMRDAIDYRIKNKIEKADYLQHLLAVREKKKLNDVEVVANAVTFFLDGFETSSLNLTFTLYELGRNKRVQEKLRKEIMEAEEDTPLTMEAIADLPYLDQVLHESLRLNPPVTFLSKRCTEDCKLFIDRAGKQELEVTKGMTILLPVWSIHRDPRNYADPLDFIPERFDADQGGVKAYRDKGAFLSFGDGPRICLGMRFALTQIKAALVDVLKNYEVSVNPKTQEPIELDPKEFLTVAKGGVWVDFKKL